MLGWIVDSINMTITLPPHQVARLKKIVSSIPRSQRRLGVDKWHRILGKLRSMSLCPPLDPGDCSDKCRKPFATSKAKGSPCPQASMKPFQTSNDWLRTWQSALHTCTSSSRSDQPWTATTMPTDTCVAAWCCRDQPPYLRACRRRLVLHGHLQTPTGHTP